MLAELATTIVNIRSNDASEVQAALAPPMSHAVLDRRLRKLETVDFEDWS